VPLVNGQQLITPEGPGVSGKPACARVINESDEGDGALATRFSEPWCAWQQLWALADADTFQPFMAPDFISNAPAALIEAAWA
jgi:hypothetical protein